MSYIVIASTAAKGKSGTVARFPSNPTSGTRVKDGDVYWAYSTNIAATDNWKASTDYSVGNAVLDSRNNAYVMVATAAGLSGTAAPALQNPSGQPATVTDGDLLWADIGTSIGAGTRIDTWNANSSFSLGSVVKGQKNGHYYQLIRFVAGTSGSTRPDLPIMQPSTVIEPRNIVSDRGAHDSTGNLAAMHWEDSGVVRPLGLQLGNPPVWQPNTQYQEQQVIFVPGMGNGRYYKTLNAGVSGPSSPFIRSALELPLTWQDSGTAAPPSIASGQPADQNVNLINLALPQTHSLSYFNIAAGVIGDTKRPPIFGYVPASKIKLPPGLVPGPIPASGSTFAIDPTTGCTIATAPNTGTTTTNAYYCPAKTGQGPLSIDPVLVLTIYAPPVDAETQWHFNRWNWWRNVIPGFSTGISLASPTSNFYIGGSNEAFLRNIQVFYGCAFQKTATALGPLATQPPWGGTGTAPSVSTVASFQKGFFVG